MDQHPALAPLVLLLKALLAQQQLGDVATGGLGGWALTSLVLAHLQVGARKGPASTRG